MRRRHETDSLMAEINITPFTDVILVLLIIFMIATPLIAQSSIEVKLPTASSNEMIKDSKPFHITISGEGVVYVENKVVNNKELKQKVEDLVAKNPDLVVVVAADQSCRFREVVRIIDMLKASQVKSLNIATRNDQTAVK